MPNPNQQLDQTAVLSKVEGKAHIIRDGYFYLAEQGMALEPGDRLTTTAGSKVVVDFSGTNQDLIVSDGSAATLFVSSDTVDGKPQWIVSDLYGEEVYFAEAGSEMTPDADPQSLYGLFGAADTTSTDLYPIVGTIGAATVAALAYDSANDDDTATGTTTSAAQSDTSGADSTAGNPDDTTATDGTTDSSTNPDTDTTTDADTPADSATTAGPLDGTPLADSPLGDAASGLPSLADTPPADDTAGPPSLADTPLADTPLGSAPLIGQSDQSNSDPSLDAALAPLQDLAPEQLSDTLGTVANTLGIGTSATLPINEGLPVNDPTGTLPG